MAKIENEFLPILNSWPLLFVVIAFLLYWSKVNCIDPRLKELAERKAKACNGTAEKKTA